MPARYGDTDERTLAIQIAVLSYIYRCLVENVVMTKRYVLG